MANKTYTTTTIPADLTTQAKDKGGRIVATIAGHKLYGLEGRSPERRIKRLERVLGGKAKVTVQKSIPKNGLNVRGQTAADVAQALGVTSE